ncbi:uncharacterized protein [Emydura macquarii macquarii]|uniref:uncharacterized protein n=1 Tax=Emydura macquarii macquarii TaxID=1129001 RepID=UPI00352A9DC6
MAAARKGRKKAQTQRRQKHYVRKSQPKRRRQARRKPVGKRGKSGKSCRGKKHSPTPYDSKLLRLLQRDNRCLSNKAKGLMISFMSDIYKKVSTEAEHLRKQSRRPTIGPSQMQAVLQQVMPRKQES